MTTDTTPIPRKIPKKAKAPHVTLGTGGLSWAEFGLLAYIEIMDAPAVADLEAAATNGAESLRHLLKGLKKKGHVELTRHVGENKRYTKGTYSLTRAA